MPLAAIAHHTNKIMKLLPFLFKIDKKPRKGLIFLEWAVLAYVVFTLLLVLFTGTKLANPDGLIWSRIRIAAIVFALWIVYRLVPCRFTMSLRVLIQMVPESRPLFRHHGGNFIRLSAVVVVFQSVAYGCLQRDYVLRLFILLSADNHRFTFLFLLP